MPSLDEIHALLQQVDRKLDVLIEALAAEDAPAPAALDLDGAAAGGERDPTAPL